MSQLREFPANFPFITALVCGHKAFYFLCQNRNLTARSGKHDGYHKNAEEGKLGAKGLEVPF